MADRGTPGLSPDERALETARRLAEEVLFPTADRVDEAASVPRERLDTLADAGLYGLAGPAEAGGLGLRDPTTGWRVIELLAGGCLSTAFVWLQHHSVVRALGGAEAGMRRRWLEALCRGRMRAGVAFSGLRRPGSPPLSAHPVAGGWRLRGEAAWVTGWGLVDVIHVGARGEGGEVVWLLVDAAASPTLSVQRLRLAAVNASSTVTLRFDDHAIPADRLVGVEEHQAWVARDAASLRPNGSLALGVAARCAALLGPTRLDAEVAACRAALDGASPGAMPAARAAASRLALEAAAALVTASGARSILAGQTAQRLFREAMFLLVFGQTRAIRQAQTAELGLVPTPPRVG
jgi:alkylation response protein AidB-like acyl-CoA dehydrogenase